MLPLICIRLPGTRDICYFQTKLFSTFTCPLLITFATKLYLRNGAYISYKFYAVHHQKHGFLFMRRKSHALVRSVFSSYQSDGVGRPFTYKVSVVISGQTRFALNIGLKWVRCPSFATHQVTVSSIVPIYRRLSRTFMQMCSDTIPFVSENHEKSWKHRFITLF